MSDAYGSVYLVGAGPGDPDLLTVKADRLLREGDVVLHDSLVDEALVTEIPAPDAEIIHVGKRPEHDRRWRQDEINRCMVTKARAAETVVRLKGGDSMVFGRGGEEAEYLAERGVPFEIVPGVTSAIAGPELAGIPVTHRDHASSLTVVTGHEDPSKDESALDWEALATNMIAGGTLVILMGVSRLPENAAALRGHGVAPETPVAVVEKAAWPEGSVTTGTLETIAARCHEEDVKPPAVVIIGDVVDIRDTTTETLLDALPRLADEPLTKRDTEPVPPPRSLLVDSTGPSSGWRLQ